MPTHISSQPRLPQKASRGKGVKLASFPCLLPAQTPPHPGQDQACTSQACSITLPTVVSPSLGLIALTHFSRMLEEKVVKGAKVKVVSDSLQSHGLYSPGNSPGQNTGVGSRSLLQGIFPTQGSNPGLQHCRQILYQLSHKGSPHQANEALKKKISYQDKGKIKMSLKKKSEFNTL